MRVLVVEDEFLIRMLICDLLEHAGYHCSEAADGEAALSLLDEEGLQPDILVTDFNLGPGMDGKDLAREAVRRLPGLPVAYVTGNPDCFVEAELNGWERLIAKPFSAEHLLGALRDLRSPSLQPDGEGVSGIQGPGPQTGNALSRAGKPVTAILT